jgi:CBS domain-containing protein
VRSITLFFFGGVAMMGRSAGSPRAEFEIAIAGPVVSALLGLFFRLLAGLPEPSSTDAVMFEWLGFINIMVALFNLLPGYPLDGGRVLRAALWARGGDALRATRAAGRAGQIVAYGFIALGAVTVLGGGDTFSGLWMAFIGWFLLTASAASLRQVAIDVSLQDLTARDVMSADVAWIDPSASVDAFARELVMRGRRWALAGEPGRTLGIVTISDVRRVGSEIWNHTPVREIITPMEQLLTATPDTALPDLLISMGEREVNQIPILEGDRVIGAVTREGLVQAIQLRDSVDP